MMKKYTEAKKSFLGKHGELLTLDLTFLYTG